MDLIDNLILGFSVAFSPQPLLYCFLGVTLGTFVGVLPGIGAMAAIAMLLPLTFSLDPTSALIMLAGMYYGAAYGGNTASILLNIPGTPSSAVTCLDGYPMTRNGRAGVALLMTTVASFVGSFVGMLLLALFSPPLAQIARSFSSPEYFSLMVLGLVATLLSSGSPFRAMAMVCLGLILGIVGTDTVSGLNRFTYGSMYLFEGLSLVAIAIGIFGLPELIRNVGSSQPVSIDARAVTFRSMIPTRDDWKRSGGAIARGTGVGSFLGALPGTGGILASFMSYAIEKRISSEPERFGNGAIEGVAAPEASNNAAIQTAFIPTLTLGIPGDVTMAIMLGALMIHGIAPGATFVADHPEIFWGLVVSFLIGNVLLLVLNIPLIGVWIRLLAIPREVLTPCIVAFVCIGVYSVNTYVVDVYVLIGFMALGVVMFYLRFEPAPLILGFILGPMLETNLRRTLALYRGDFSILFQRPLSAIFLGTALLIVAWTAYRHIAGQRTRRTGPSARTER